MNNTLIDNSEQRFMMVSTLKECIVDPQCKEIKIATGYWDIPGTALLYDGLNKFLERDNTTLQLLIGSDPIVRAYQLRNPIVDASFPMDYIKRDIQELQVKEDYVSVVRLLLRFCIEDEERSKIKIRIYKRNEEGDARFLHAKCYIFKSPDKSVGIIGSSNFTKKGMEGNAELNYLETDGAIVTAIPQEGSASKGHLSWFNELWEQAEGWNKNFQEEVLKPTSIGKKGLKEIEKEEKQITPYELYIKYLQTLFGDIADPSTNAVLQSYLPVGYNALEYQLDAVKQCFFIMRQHGGFILADVVGLGKTIVGLLVVRKFIEEADRSGRSRKVLIVTPPAIKSAWKRTIDDFDKDKADRLSDCIEFITTGSISKLVQNSFEMGDEMPEDVSDEFDGKIQYNDYGLVIIDESHNFRNNGTQKYQDLNSLIGAIQVKKGVAPYVGLLSATPQNNSPQDIKNQVYLFQREPNHSTLPNIEGGKLDSFFAEKQRRFQENRRISNTPEGQAALQEIAEEIRDKVLNDLVVRRTRKDIKTHYSQDSRQLKFPTIKGPHKLEYRMDSELCRLFSDTMNAILPDESQIVDPKGHLGFYRYSAIMFFKSDDHKRLYEKRNLTVESISRRLAKIMQILLVKRLESSFSAFKASLHNLQQYTQNMIDMLQADCVFICPDINVNAEFEKAATFDVACQNIQNKLKQKGGNNRQFGRNDLKEEYLALLMQDKELIDNLCARWDKNDLDPKLDAFKDYLQSELFSPQINNPGGYDKPRLVIFTEAIDTLNSLTRHVESKGHRVLKISAANRDEMQDEIAANFDANATTKRDDYDVIITTEVLAEGVNLHRANVILNYDTPWNATRLMQRIGRVNRIGSREEFVHVFNFYPTMQGNEQIRLIENAYAKLQAFHAMFGEDNKVFSELEQLSEADFNNFTDGEESSLGFYIAELKAYQKEHVERYKKLTRLKLKGIGGAIESDDPGTILVAVMAERRGLLNVKISQDGQNAVVSQLNFIRQLRCSQDKTFIAPIAKDRLAKMKKEAIDCYNLHITHMLSAKDASKRMTEALGAILRINERITTESARKALLAARKAVANGNLAVIKILLLYDKEYGKGQSALFDADFDVNEWVESAFRQIARHAMKKYGEPTVALFEIK